MANQGLVADYGSSSESEGEIENLKNNEEEDLTLFLKGRTTHTNSINYFENVIEDELKPSGKEVKKKVKPKCVANPLRGDVFTKACVEPSLSVFYNPFQKDQEAKNSVLEKHVKLTTNPKDVVEINGKKICWNYRKGRCKFGHNCKYAHDSDLIGTSNSQKNSVPLSSLNDGYNPPDDTIIQADSDEMRKRKPGLAEGLVPNKRSRMKYKEIQSKETPWMNKR